MKNNKLKPSVELFTDLMRLRGGVLSAVARDLGMPSLQVYNLYNKDAEYRNSVNVGLQGTFDVALSNVSTAIASGDLDTSKWFIEKFGKKLGVFEVQEQAVSKTKIIIPKEFENDDSVDFEDL